MSPDMIPDEVVEAAAADTITTLRAEVETVGAMHRDACKLAKHRMQEVERLRATNERLNRELDDVWAALVIQREDNASFGDAFKRMTSEIERLRDDLAHADAKGQENDKLLWGTIKDNERLRAALREIDHARYTGRNTINPDNAFEHAISLNEKLIAVMDIARAALAPSSANFSK